MRPLVPLPLSPIPFEVEARRKDNAWTIHLKVIAVEGTDIDEKEEEEDEEEKIVKYFYLNRRLFPE